MAKGRNAIRKIALSSLLGAVLSFISVTPAHAADLNQSFSKEVRPIFDKYCFSCHNAKKTKGDVNLTQYDTLVSVFRDARTWEKVSKQLHDRDMPPEGKKQPSQAERETMLGWSRDALASIDFASVKDPGRKIIHRLNRAEYNNTVRDLFGVSVHPADNFPADGGGGGGFDNNADTLFLPPILMEKYLAAADEVLNAAIKEQKLRVHPLERIGANTTAKNILEYYLSRAFRRPVDQEELGQYFKIFATRMQQGDTFEEAIKLPLKAMLVSPNFLFRTEHEQAGNEAYTINDFELATRLSYFLWSSMPDDTLTDLAYQNRLHEPQVLKEQVTRMLADPKARALAENFAGQWLGVNKLKTTVQPDTRKFPQFTPALRESFYEEPIAFFQDLIQRDASLMNLLTANYAIVNETLAKFYGMPPVKGEEFQRISLQDDKRGGLLGMGGILTLTSYPQRTSPVLRGKWVLEEILGTPAPPPPPNAGGLPADDRPREGLTFRQRLEQHRSRPECSSCHSKMDPIGFGLENFDAIGAWREKIGDQPVDATGEFSGGVKFTGPAALKKVLLKDKDNFFRNVSEKMLAYALGRGLEYYDVPSVRKITDSLAKNDYRTSTLVMEVVMSYPFQHRRGNNWQEASNR